MLGIEDYGSDVESGDECSETTKTVTATATESSNPTRPTSTSSLLSKLPPPTSKSTLALPPPKSSRILPPASSSSGLVPMSTTSADSAVLPKPKRTKKIAINLPSFPPPDNDEEDKPPSKKPRISSSSVSGAGAGAGKSSLLSMLPAPKRPVPVVEKKKEQEERVLGGGGGPGLVFRTNASKSDARAASVTSVDGGDAAEVEGPVDIGVDVSGPSTSFVPPSLKKGRSNVSLEEAGSSRKAPSLQKSSAPSVDFFSLGSSAASPARSTPTPSSTPSTSYLSTVTSAPYTSASASSSAPAISTFRPPSPTLDDPYPGYYQLPSGAYVPYDADYYASYAKKWKAEYDKHIRSLEKSQHEPDADGAQDVDMAAEMEKARREIKEREDRKALTTGNTATDENGEQVMPRMNVKGAKLGAVARSRHQLTTLLTEAYLNREALEERIAQGRRNRKEAGNKYGF